MDAAQLRSILTKSSSLLQVASGIQRQSEQTEASMEQGFYLPRGKSEWVEMALGVHGADG